MQRLILLILLLPAGFVAAKVGWPGLIVIVTALVVVYGYLLLKDTGAGWIIVMYAAAFVWVALFVGWGLYMLLMNANLEDNLSQQALELFEFFAGTDLLKAFWAAIGGVTAAVLVLALVIVPLTLMQVQNQGNKAGQSSSSGVLRALRRTLGMVPAEWVAREGEVRIVKQPKSSQSPMTGPGEIEVQQGHVVILEQNGAVTRILPTGVHWVKPHERIGMLVPLYGRVDQVPVTDIVTHDGLTIEELELTIFHRVHPGEKDEQTANGQFPYSEDILREQMWSPKGGDWREGVKGVTAREARNLISNYTLEEFLTLSSEGRTEFKQQLEPRVNAVTRNLMGVGVTLTGIGAIRLPAKAAEKLAERWAAARDHEIETETAEGRRDAFNLLFGAMQDALQQHPDVKDLLVMSFIERMAHAADEPSQGASSELDTLNRLYMLEALKKLGAQQPPSENTARD